MKKTHKSADHDPTGLRFGWWQILLLLLLLCIALFGDKGLGRLLKTFQQKLALEAQVDAAAKEKQAWKEQIRDLQDPNSGVIEKKARELNYTHPDEIIYLFPGTGEPKDEQPTNETEAVERCDTSGEE